MKKLILSTCCFLCLLSFKSIAQYFPGPPIDSTTITFNTTDSLVHNVVDPIIIDTSFINTGGLWQIGNTTKPIFSTNGIISRGIMTDTTGFYPSNSNNYFTLKLTSNFNSYSSIPNPIIEVWHEYQTDSFHAGGIIEFPFDSGASWLNVFDCSNIPLQSSITDTIYSGSKAFMGNSNGQKFSSFYFFDCLGEKLTGTTDCNALGEVTNNLYLRFRFQSDSTQDTLSGWKIDSIKIVFISCGGGVPSLNKSITLSINPNPAFNGIFNFPAMEDEGKYTIDIFNELGEKILTMPYQHNVNIGNYAKGLYFYKVTGNNEQYSGKLLYE